MSEHQLVLHGGEVIDPASGRRGQFDVAFTGDRVTAIDPGLDGASTVDVTGCLVVPGLIDLHSHVFEGIGEGVNADEFGLRRGTTTTVDGGSSGARSFGAFRRITSENQCRTLAWLNLSTIGQVDLRVGELMVAPWIDVDSAVRIAEANRDLIVGFKARLSTYVCGGSCLPALRAVREAGERTGLPFMVHIGDTGEPLTEVLPLLRAGDVVTHTLTGRKYGFVGPDGKILPAAFEARARGVLFDAARGRNHVSFPIMQAAVEQGFLPDSLATDVTITTGADPAFGLPLMMTHLLSFGVPVAELIPRVTVNPARALRRDDLGRLAVGGIGDATVLRIVDGPYAIADVDGRTRETQRRVVPVGVVRAGTWVPAA
ncbi:MAG: amidohydrolase family protein [Chloroflexota bacterium]